MSRLLAASLPSRFLTELTCFGLASFVLAPSPAEACSPTPDPIVQLSAPEVPVGGIVVFRIRGVTPIEQLIVKQDESDVAGTFAVFDEDAKLYTWTPAAELTVGTVYSVGPSDELAEPFRTEFTAVAGSSDPPQIETLISRITVGVDPVLCASSWRTDRSDGSDCSSEPFVLFERRSFRPHLELLLSGANRSQFVYDVEWSTGGEPTVATRVFANALANTFNERPLAVCYSLVARPIDGGEPFELSDECVTLDGIDLEPTDDDVGHRRAFFENCLVPPTSSAGDEMTREWCNAFRSQIEANDCTGAPRRPCKAALERCSAEDFYDDTENEGSDEDSNDSANDADDEAGGCSISSSSHLSSTPTALALAVAAVALTLRRRQAP